MDPPSESWVPWRHLFRRSIRKPLWKIGTLVGLHEACDLAGGRGALWRESTRGGANAPPQGTLSYGWSIWHTEVATCYASAGDGAFMMACSIAEASGVSTDTMHVARRATALHPPAFRWPMCNIGPCENLRRAICESDCRTAQVFVHSEAIQQAVERHLSVHVCQASSKL